MTLASVFLNLKTTLFRLIEWFRVVFRYYRRSLRFLLADGLLAVQYLLKTPHRVSRDFLKKRGVGNIYQYGETPLTTLDKITRECRLLSRDTVYELGCGSGRTLLWLAAFVGCRAIGIDYLPAFVEKGRRAARWAGLERVELRCEDMLHCDLYGATCIYLYGTCLEEEMIEALVKRFEQLRPGLKVITVSYPLTDYSDRFEVVKSFTGRFPWGKATLFLNLHI